MIFAMILWVGLVELLWLLLRPRRRARQGEQVIRIQIIEHSGTGESQPIKEKAPEAPPLPIPANDSKVVQLDQYRPRPQPARRRA